MVARGSLGKIFAMDAGISFPSTGGEEGEVGVVGDWGNIGGCQSCIPSIMDSALIENTDASR